MSGEYRYSLELSRKESNLDPTADFLINLKEGHCERYAGGLALMLRSLGVRCRVVKGFLGSQVDEEGYYGVVRLNRAHSWVQALVPGDEPGDLAMADSGPDAVQREPRAGDRLVVPLVQGQPVRRARVFWRQFILEYTPDQQMDVLTRFAACSGRRRGCCWRPWRRWSWAADAWVAAWSPWSAPVCGCRRARGLRGVLR